jgi:hypothetical protein
MPLICRVRAKKRDGLAAEEVESLDATRDLRYTGGSYNTRDPEAVEGQAKGVPVWVPLSASKWLPGKDSLRLRPGQALWHLFSKANFRMIFLKPGLNLDFEFSDCPKKVLGLFFGITKGSHLKSYVFSPSFWEGRYLIFKMRPLFYAKHSLKS